MAAEKTPGQWEPQWCKCGLEIDPMFGLCRDAAACRYVAAAAVRNAALEEAARECEMAFAPYPGTLTVRCEVARKIRALKSGGER